MARMLFSTQRVMATVVLWAAVPTIILMASCSKVSCVTPQLSSFAFYANDTIRDTAIVVIKFEGASNFSRPVDTTFIGSNVISPSGLGGKSLFVSYGMQPNFDYTVQLLPSLKIHTVKNIKIGSDKIYGGQYKDSYCVSSWSCVADDSTEASPMMPNESVQPYFPVYIKY